MTGLGTLGHESISEAITARLAEMVSVSPETWELLRRANGGGALGASFEQARSNGIAFAQAFAEVAADEYQQLYEMVIAALRWHDLRLSLRDLNQAQRRRLSVALGGGWPEAALPMYEDLAGLVAHRTAALWQERLASTRESEAMMWRILRMGSAPYFVLGTSSTVEDRHSGTQHVVKGHVEVRWSHGRFSGNPEAKVYLDTAHADVPGYFSLR
ncbi:MAG: hypothetical protein ACYCZM_08750 [Acidimicrobiales bacterium]